MRPLATALGILNAICVVMAMDRVSNCVYCES